MFLSKIFVPLSIAVLVSCQTAPVKTQAVAAPLTYKDKILTAQRISKSNPQRAITMLDELLSSNSENNLSDDALFLLGTLLEKQGQDDAAIRAYERILTSKYVSPLDGSAILNKAKLHLKHNDRKSAQDTLSFVARHELQDQSKLNDIETLRSKLLFESEDYFTYLKSTHNLIETSADQKTKETLFKKAIDVLKIKILGTDNKKVLNDPDLTLFHPQAALNLAEYYIEDQKPEAGISVLETYDSLFQGPYYKSQKDELARRTQLYTAPNINTIGVIIPLTGKYQAVGSQILKGLQFSLDVWNAQSRPQLKLAVLDSEEDPTQASYAFDELMNKDRPIAFVGGLVSKTAEALIQKANEYKAPTLILSQKEGLTDTEKYAFQNAQPMEIYTDLIAKLAVDTLKLKRIALLFSNQNFSKSYAEAFKKSFTQAGGEIAAEIEYNLEERRSLPNSIKKLVKLDAIGERREEYQKAFKEWEKSSHARGASSTPNLEDILPPLIDFDAIFVADGAKNGGLIASTLAYYDVEKIPLLGTHLWNDLDLIERGQRFVENSIFASSYYEPSVLNSECGQRFMRFFQEPITPFIHKGIEAGIILKSMYAMFDIDSRASLTRALANVSTLTNSCLPQGLIRQAHNFYSPLLPLSVQNKSIVVFDPKTYTPMVDKSPKF